MDKICQNLFCDIQLLIQQANLAKFMAGDFISVTLEDCRARIRDIAGEDIGDDAYGSFRALANHRNKMVHFFHNGLENDEKAKAQIVAELKTVQGKPVDIGGYYKADPEKCKAIMRPSPTLNAALKAARA